MAQVNVAAAQTGSRAKAAPSWWAIEDWMAVWLGAFVLIAILAGYRPVLPAMKWAGFGALGAVFNSSAIVNWLLLAAAMLAVSLPGIILMGGNALRYALGFPVVFVLALGAQLLAGNAVVTQWGIEYVIFALILGLLISNGPGTPKWLQEAVRTEYFIKTGLVVMGATLLFEEILQAGALGIVQSVAVVIVVWYFAFWLAKRLRLDDEFAAMLSTAVSICGVSAAIAACGAIQGDKRKLSYTTSIVLLVAAPMIIIQPWLIKIFAIPDIVAGAWLGGTLDTTGSVVAAGALISETAMKTGTVVKFSQNVLIGIAAFLLSLWWTLREPAAKGQPRPGAGVIWERFPKFVLGFMAASLIFSFLLDPALVKATKSTIGGIRTWWFALAFVSIGLETRFTDLFKMEGGRPFLSFLGAQAFNLLWTLLLAWLVFGGVLFPVPAMGR